MDIRNDLIIAIIKILPFDILHDPHIAISFFTVLIALGWILFLILKVIISKRVTSVKQICRPLLILNLFVFILFISFVIQDSILSPNPFHPQVVLSIFLLGIFFNLLFIEYFLRKMKDYIRIFNIHYKSLIYQAMLIAFITITTLIFLKTEKISTFNFIPISFLLVYSIIFIFIIRKVESKKRLIISILLSVLPFLITSYYLTKIGIKAAELGSGYGNFPFYTLLFIDLFHFKFYISLFILLIIILGNLGIFRLFSVRISNIQDKRILLTEIYYLEWIILCIATFFVVHRLLGPFSTSIYIERPSLQFPTGKVTLIFIIITFIISRIMYRITPKKMTKE